MVLPVKDVLLGREEPTLISPTMSHAQQLLWGRGRGDRGTSLGLAGQPVYPNGPALVQRGKQGKVESDCRTPSVNLRLVLL